MQTAPGLLLSLWEDDLVRPDFESGSLGSIGEPQEWFPGLPDSPKAPGSTCACRTNAVRVPCAQWQRSGTLVV